MDNFNIHTLIYFEDGFIRVPDSKQFYLLIDDSEKNNLEIKKQVADLKIGDKIFLMSRFNDDFNELLNFLKMYRIHQLLKNCVCMMIEEL